MRRLTNIALLCMEVAEVLPARNVGGITALAAATAIWDYLATLGRPET